MNERAPVHETMEAVPVSYSQTGSGDDVILLHGAAANRAFWSIPILIALKQNHRVTTYDLRGHGYSPRPDRGYKPQDMAADLRLLMDSLDIERAHVIGHSLGGIIGLQYALDLPSRVRSLTLLDSRIRAVQPRQILPQTPVWQHVLSSLTPRGCPLEEDPELGLALLEALAGPDWKPLRDDPPSGIQYLPFAGSDRGARRFYRLLHDTTAREELRHPGDITTERLRDLDVPCLAMYGDRSPYYNTGLALAEALPNCELTVVKDGAHYHPVIQVQGFLDTALEFLSRA